jgi:hypothetical protein
MVEKKPPFASGELVGDYGPLFEYWKIAREKGREDLVEAAMLSEEDYRMLQETAYRGEEVLDLIERLTEKILDRIDPEIASEALSGYGVKAPPDEARRFIAKLIAAWLIEAGEYWCFIKLRRGLPPRKSGEG